MPCEAPVGPRSEGVCVCLASRAFQWRSPIPNRSALKPRSGENKQAFPTEVLRVRFLMGGNGNAEVLVLGLGGAGKTTLVRRLERMAALKGKSNKGQANGPGTLDAKAVPTVSRSMCGN